MTVPEFEVFAESARSVKEYVPKTRVGFPESPRPRRCKSGNRERASHRALNPFAWGDLWGPFYAPQHTESRNFEYTEPEKPPPRRRSSPAKTRAPEACEYSPCELAALKIRRPIKKIYAKFARDVRFLCQRKYRKRISREARDGRAN